MSYYAQFRKNLFKRSFPWGKIIAALLVIALIAGAAYFVYEYLQGPDSIGNNNGIGKIPTSSGYDITIKGQNAEINNGKFASVSIPGSAIADDIEKVSVTIYETDNPKSTVVEEGFKAQSYYVDIDGLAKNNDAAVKIYIFVIVVHCSSPFKLVIIFYYIIFAMSSGN